MSANPLARFTVRGSRPVRIEVEGPLDASTTTGFRAVVDFFVGDPEVTIDLHRCERIDDVGLLALSHAISRIRKAGGSIAVLPEPPGLA